MQSLVELAVYLFLGWVCWKGSKIVARLVLPDSLDNIPGPPPASFFQGTSAISFPDNDHRTLNGLNRHPYRLQATWTK